jgi:dCTP deaminase
VEPDLGLTRQAEGVLPAQWIRKAIAAGVVTAPVPVDDDSVQPASLDLRLGETAYRLRCSFLPETERVEDKLADLAMGELDLRDGAVLEQNRPYLIPLLEGLELPAGLAAKANPKSSTGRLDLFTRVITDRSYKFDEIPPGYSGKLYLEVVSRSFTVKVRTGLSLNQLRLVVGKADYTDEDIRRQHADRSPLVWFGETPVPQTELAISRGLLLSLDLSGVDGSRLVGYRAKKNSQLVDLSQVDYYDADEFWEPVTADRRRRIVLEPEEFYLLLSREGVSVPPDLAAEMTAYDPTSGELRTHYAGFFDPGFGYRPDTGGPGSRAALEVRAHDVPFMVEHGQRVCTLTYERMLETPDVLYGATSSHYQFQTQALSKHFRMAADTRRI